VTAYVDATGSVVAEYAYDAFGNEITQTTNSPTANHFSFRHSTKYWDEETGFYYYGYRYYAPTAARWLTLDPLEEQGGLNLHAFCENDGVNKYDWLGLFPEMPQKNDGRRFWRLLAKRLRVEKGYKYAALMLENSLDHARYRFGESSQLSSAIKRSMEYDLEVKWVVANCPVGKSHVRNERGRLDYNEGDLLSAVNRTLTNPADVYFSGKVCKKRMNGPYHVDLDVKVVSEYGYGDWRYDELTLSEADKVNMQKYRSLVGELSWRAEFDDKRDL